MSGTSGAPGSETVLMFADTLRSPDLRHVVPLGVGDPFIYAEHTGRRVAFLPSIEVPRARELDGLEVVPYEDIGLDQLVAKGMRFREARLELLARACDHIGIKDAVTPADFPLAGADLLRSRGVTLRSDEGFFVDRRRVKTAGELAGVRRAQEAAQIAMETMRRAIQRGGAVSSESLRTEALRETAGSEAFFEYMIVAHGAQAG